MTTHMTAYLRIVTLILSVRYAFILTFLGNRNSSISVLICKCFPKCSCVFAAVIPDQAQQITRYGLGITLKIKTKYAGVSGKRV